MLRSWLILKPDFSRSRMQVIAARQNMLRTMIQFASRDGMGFHSQTSFVIDLTSTGIPSLWWGISASVLRQSTYSTARFGLYNYFAREARRRTGQQRLSSPMEIACAGAAGGLAGLIGNPTEVCVVMSLNPLSR